MSKYIDAEKMIVFLEKEKAENIIGGDYSDGVLDACDNILAFIDSLQQEMWKPSKEQITAVEAAYSVLNSHDTWCEDEHLPTLMSLINALQKLF